MRDVVFVEAEPAAGTSGAPTDTGASSGNGPANAGAARPIVARLRSRWWWAVVAGLILAVVANSVVTDRRENARMAALSTVPGILAPLDGPVAELWHADGVQNFYQAEFAGRLLVVERRPGGKTDVVALDPRTGHQAWRTALRPATADAGTATEPYATGCTFPETPVPTKHESGTAVVACVVADETTTISDDEAGESTYPTKAHLLVIDATTGAVLSDAPTDPSTSVTPLGADLVMSRIDADGRVQVTRTDALGAATRWTFTSPDPVSQDSFGQRSAHVGASEGVISVSAGSNFVNDTGQGTGHSSWLLSADGDVIDTETTDSLTSPTWAFGVLPGGRLLFKSATTDADADAPTMTFTNRATGRSFTAEGSPVVVSPDDGSLADLVLTGAASNDKLTAYAIASGKPKWTVGRTAPGGGMASGDGMASGGGMAVLLDGRIIRSGPRTLTSIDGRTGKTVWTTPTKQTESASLVTDGRLVLLAQPTESGDTVLTAYGVDDGRRRWHTRIAGSQWLFVSGGRLYGASDRKLVALG